MKAAVYTQYGSPDVLHITEVAKPTPKDNEVLIRVRAAAVNFGDTLARDFASVTPGKFNMPLLMWLPAKLMIGYNRPRQTILGAEFAGDVEAVGKNVTRFKVGEAVFGYRAQNFGANAEYLCMPEDGLLAPKPANMSYEEAAAVPYGAITALTLLRKVNIQRGQKVLIIGASGGIGSAAVQLAKHYFGAEVTGVCGPAKVEFVKALGADKVIDYTKQDFTQSGQTYDLIFDILGKGSFSRSKHLLNPNGHYFYASFKMKQVFQMLWTSRMSDKKVICALSNEKPEDLVFVKELVEEGKFKTIIDKCFPLEQTADAHRYCEGGQAGGKIIVRVNPA